MRWIEPAVLTGDDVILEPLAPAHAGELAEACGDGALWRLWFTFVPHPGGVEDYIAEALARRDATGEMPFAVRDQASDRVIGSTRYCHVDEANRRLEVGYTWYAQRFQRTAVNSQCKLLLLQHAFEALGSIAVEFRTHWHNHASRAAIARLGAKQDGVLRNHQKTAEGVYRDTVVFSIIDLEWPAVKQALQFRLARA